MPNPKRKFRKMSSVRRHASYSTLSDVEDREDRFFLAKIARVAAINAINENKAMNIPVTVLEGDWVVRKGADGSVNKIARIDRRNDTGPGKILTKGAILYVKGRL